MVRVPQSQRSAVGVRAESLQEAASVSTDSSVSPRRTSTSAGSVEIRSIDYVPSSERRGKLWRQGPFWFLGNLQFFTIATGFVGPAFGLSVGWNFVAGALGIIFGTLFMAFHASQGPHLGLPQMIQSRAQLGYRGVIVALAASLFTFLAFNVVDQVLISEGLHGLFGWNRLLVSVVVSLVALTIAIYGHDWLHRVFQLLCWIGLPLYVILTIGILSGQAGGDSTVTLGWNGKGFIAQFAVAAAYNITYAPYVSDYSRYLPRTTPVRRIVASVFLGASGSAIWLIGIGGWLAVRLGAVDGLVALNDAGNNVMGNLGKVLALHSVIALVATMGLNAYSAMLSVVTAVDSFRPIKPSRRWRVIVLAVLCVVWFVAARQFDGGEVGVLFASLSLMLWVLVPWTAINLVDYFFIRRGRFATAHMFSPKGVYGTWSWRGLLSYGVGMLVMYPFLNIIDIVTFDEVLVGPIGRKIGSDISFLIGLPVSAIVYYLLSRNVDRTAEEAAIPGSERALEALDALR
jgi:nucleobase:cation symporter-1, NCS1 family